MKKKCDKFVVTSIIDLFSHINKHNPDLLTSIWDISYVDYHGICCRITFYFFSVLRNMYDGKFIFFWSSKCLWTPGPLTQTLFFVNTLIKKFDESTAEQTDLLNREICMFTKQHDDGCCWNETVQFIDWALVFKINGLCLPINILFSYE